MTTQTTIMTPEEAQIRAAQLIHEPVNGLWRDLPRLVLAVLLTAAPESEVPAILADSDRLDQILSDHPHLLEALTAPEIGPGVITVISASLGVVIRLGRVTAAHDMVPMVTSPVVDVEASIEQASDRLALLAATICGLMDMGEGFSASEARGALSLLEVVQLDLEAAKTALQGLDTRLPLKPQATPAAA